MVEGIAGRGDNPHYLLFFSSHDVFKTSCSGLRPNKTESRRRRHITDAKVKASVFEMVKGIAGRGGIMLVVDVFYSSNNVLKTPYFKGSYIINNDVALI